jgi:hypothetical protein
VYIREVQFDDWRSTDDEGSIIQDADERTLERLINRLDGKRFTLVILRGPGEDQLAIGGGLEGRYVMYQTRDNETFWEPSRESAPDERVVLVVGGQTGEYPARQVVGSQEAIAAATEYARKGSLTTAVRWIEI